MPPEAIFRTGSWRGRDGGTTGVGGWGEESDNGAAGVYEL
jgi:hypothetical protein